MTELDKKALETLDLELAILVRRITSITAQKRIGSLDRSAYLLLAQISDHRAVGVKTLADEFHLDISTVSRQTAALEQKGYVERSPDPQDGRAYYLQITKLGLRMLEESQAARVARLSELLKSWSNEESEQLGALLKKFNRTFL